MRTTFSHPNHWAALLFVLLTSSAQAVVRVELIELPVAPAHHAPQPVASGGGVSLPPPAADGLLSERFALSRTGKRLERISLEEFFNETDRVTIFTVPELLEGALPANTDLVIDLTLRRAYLRVDGAIALETEIALQRGSTQAPHGMFAVTERIEDGKVANFFETTAPYWMRLGDTDFGIYGGQLMDYPWAAGCIRLPLPAAEWIYERTQSGTPIRVYETWHPQIDAGSHQGVLPSPRIVAQVEPAAPSDDLPMADIEGFSVGSAAPFTVPATLSDNLSAGLPSFTGDLPPSQLIPVSGSVASSPFTAFDPGKTLVVDFESGSEPLSSSAPVPQSAGLRPVHGIGFRSDTSEPGQENREPFLRRLMAHFPSDFFPERNGEATSPTSPTSPTLPHPKESGSGLRFSLSNLPFLPDGLSRRDEQTAEASQTVPAPLIPVTSQSAENAAPDLVTAPSPPIQSAAAPAPGMSHKRIFGAASKDSSFRSGGSPGSLPARLQTGEPIPPAAETVDEPANPEITRFRDFLKRR